MPINPPSLRALPAGDVFRARLIRALADGLSYREIERARFRCEHGGHRNPAHVAMRLAVGALAAQCGHLLQQRLDSVSGFLKLGAKEPQSGQQPQSVLTDRAGTAGRQQGRRCEPAPP